MSALWWLLWLALPLFHLYGDERKEQAMKGLSTKGHLPGRPVSRSTYGNFGCRCDACTAAATLYQAQLRRKAGGLFASDKAYAKANREAAKWVRENHPDVFADLLRAAHGEQWGVAS